MPKQVFLQSVTCRTQFVLLNELIPQIVQLRGVSFLFQVIKVLFLAWWMIKLSNGIFNVFRLELVSNHIATCYKPHSYQM